MHKNPISQFAAWFSAAKRHESIADATAMCLSTVGAGGFPDARMVLLKGFDSRGFTFFTNLHSAKGKELAKRPKAALTFYWPPLIKQVRVQGQIEIVSEMEADAYWKTRPRLSQLSACASRQSEVLRKKSVLVKEVARLTLKYQNRPIPRPAYWTGVRVVPRQIEFWLGGAHRLHDRFLYRKKAGRWKIARLYP